MRDTIVFPSEDEDVGSVTIGLRGHPYTAFEDLAALQVLYAYLTDSPVSLLHRCFVDLEQPYCSEVCVQTNSQLVSAHALMFENAAVHTLSDIEPRLFHVVRKHFLGEAASSGSGNAALQHLPEDSGFDLQRMQLVVQREIRSLLDEAERRPHRTIAHLAIGDFLYGDRIKGAHLPGALNTLTHLRKIGTYTRDQWISIARKHLLEAPYVCLIAKPSKEHARILAATEEARVAAQVKTLGPERLAAIAKELEAAKVANGKPVPKSLLENFPSPRISAIQFLPVQTAWHPAVNATPTSVAEKHIAGDVAGKGFPIPIQFDRAFEYWHRFKLG